jgi:hypothetical protein
MLFLPFFIHHVFPIKWLSDIAVCYRTLSKWIILSERTRCFPLHFFPICSDEVSFLSLLLFVYFRLIHFVSIREMCKSHKSIRLLAHKIPKNVLLVLFDKPPSILPAHSALFPFFPFVNDSHNFQFTKRSLPSVAFLLEYLPSPVYVYILSITCASLFYCITYRQQSYAAPPFLWSASFLLKVAIVKFSSSVAIFPQKISFRISLPDCR